MFGSENDNKPEFGKKMLEVKVKENDERRYQMAFEGALDVDEGVNGDIAYELECSSVGGERRNCSQLFQLIVLSQSHSFNQRDQLLLKSIASLDEDSYEVTVHASDCRPVHKCRGTRLTSSMIIRLSIDKPLVQLRFGSSKYEFVIKMAKLLSRGDRLGRVHVQKQSDGTKRARASGIGYRIVNGTNNDIGINSVTGDLLLLNEQVLLDHEHISLHVESFYTHKHGYSATSDVLIYFRLLDRVQKISLSYARHSAGVSSIEPNVNKVLIQQSLLSAGAVLLSIRLLPSYYVSDEYRLHLDTHRSLFTVASSQTNNYSLSIVDPSVVDEAVYSVRVLVQHQLTQQWLSPLVIDLHFLRSDEVAAATAASAVVCEEDDLYDLYDAAKTSWAGKVRVVSSNANVSSFSTFFVSPMGNASEVMDVGDCRMVFVNKSVILSEYLMCGSSSVDVCYNITLTRELEERSATVLFVLRPIEMAIVAVSCVFVLATMALSVIICRLRGVHVCVRVKNYVFYGKKYGLSHAQRLSTAKMTVSDRREERRCDEEQGRSVVDADELCFCLATCAFDCCS